MLKVSFFIAKESFINRLLFSFFQHMMVLQKPFHAAQFGHLPAGKPEVPVNTGLADRPAGNPRKHWAGWQPLRKRPFYAGCGAGGVRVFGRGGYSDGDAFPRHGAPICFGYFWDGS